MSESKSASDPTSKSAPTPSDHPIADIFRGLKHGLGRERVTDHNVEVLFATAKIRRSTARSPVARVAFEL